MAEQSFLPHSSHWGAFSGAWTNGALAIRPHPGDPAPSALLDNLKAAPRHASRIARPLVREGWLKRGPGPDPARGSDSFVEMGWDQALGLLATELKRVHQTYPPNAIFGGSYGWSSAGRFHHAQSQVHRFLNCALGGYVRSVNTYSSGAAAVIMPHVIGNMEHYTRGNDHWRELAERTDMVVAFGGLPIRNAVVSAGGNSNHVAPGALERAARRGCRFVMVTPLRDDFPTEVAAEWLPARPASDTALMLGLAYALVEANLHDRAFLDRYTTGFARFERYLTGADDGTPKTPEWAAALSGIGADVIGTLARDMAKGRTLVTVSYSLQRSESGEQPVWMGIVLAAMLGQLGLEGGGFSLGLGSIGNIGKPPLGAPIPTLPQGKNGVADYIPVARIADLLLKPGEPFAYDGKTLTYPDIRLVYWAGGNPFHHHQDLRRLARAFQRPDTVVIHDAFSTASTRFADFVLPATITLERDDIGAAGNDPKLIAMHKMVQPFGEALDDFEIFRRLAQRLDREAEFTENRTSAEWLRHLYEPTREALVAAGLPAPAFEIFWRNGETDLPLSDKPSYIRAFRDDPDKNPLKTPSGKVEIFSETIAGFGYADCLGHPAWLAPTEWLGAERAGRFPIQLVANQPAGRLHSQLDFGPYSQSHKVKGRERLRLNPADARARGIADGDVVRVSNDRGACLAGASITDHVAPGVAQLSTGAWYDPQTVAGVGEVCAHGNPNVLTRDQGTSSLAQGCAGQLVLVEIEKLGVSAPDVTAHRTLKGAVGAMDTAVTGHQR